MNGSRRAGSHVYVHVPFCSRRCTYCDFSIAVRRHVPRAEFAASIARELGVRDVRKANSDSDSAESADTVFFGGGTPSKLGVDGVEALIRVLGDSGISFDGDSEVTIEANPEDVTASAAAAWRRLGITRLSVGVQSLSSAALQWMHRTHGPEAAAAAVRSARLAGFRNVSVDLIYALPASVGRSWSDDLRRVVDLGPDHMSVYGLTVEAHTPLGRWTARGDVVARPAEQAADEFLEAHDTLTSAGYEHYEVSNYARPGMRGRHNSAYWLRVPYLGLGPSAHSFDGTSRRWNVAAYAAWTAALAKGADPLAGTEALGDCERLAEEVYLGLRTDAGVELASGADVATGVRWVREGWATMQGNRVRLTAEGWLRLDALAITLGAR